MGYLHSLFARFVSVCVCVHMFSSQNRIGLVNNYRPMFFPNELGGTAGGGGGAAAAEAPTAAAAAPVVEKDAFDLKLSGFDAAGKIKLIKEVRTITGLGLKEVSLSLFLCHYVSLSLRLSVYLCMCVCVYVSA